MIRPYAVEWCYAALSNKRQERAIHLGLFQKRSLITTTCLKSKDALGYVLTALFAIALIACVQGRAAASCAGASMEAHLANTETSTFEKALFANGDVHRAIQAYDAGARSSANAAAQLALIRIATFASKVAKVDRPRFRFVSRPIQVLIACVDTFQAMRRRHWDPVLVDVLAYHSSMIRRIRSSFS